MKKLAQGFNTAAQDSNLGPLSRESEALPLSHCSLVLVKIGEPPVLSGIILYNQYVQLIQENSEKNEEENTKTDKLIRGQPHR